MLKFAFDKIAEFYLFTAPSPSLPPLKFLKAVDNQ